VSAPPGVSVTLIAKNCAGPLKECLESLQPFLRPDLGDEIIVVDTGSTDDTPATAEACGARVFRHPELNSAGMLDLVKKHLPDYAEKCVEDPQFKDGFLADFAAARELSMSYAKNPLVMWIDADDILTGGAALRQYAIDYLEDPERSCIFLAYDYSFDPDGKCSTVLWRERIVRKDLYRWAGVCHESLIPKSGHPGAVGRVPEDVSKIVHKHGRFHIFSDVRNYAILREAHEKAEWKDPRWEFYLGNACRGLSRWTECIAWYCRVLQRSGSRDDRLSAALNIAYCHILLGRAWRAIDWFAQAMKIAPDEPRAYFGTARAYFDLKNYRRVLLYTQLGRSLGTPDTITSVDPNHFDYYPGAFEAMALKEIGDPEAALKVATEVRALRPDLEASDELYRDVLAWAQQEQLKRAVQLVSSTAFSEQAAIDIIQAVKPEIRAQIPELQVETFCTSPKRSITFLCGLTAETWDPTSEIDGVGGSEKMVIQLARRLAKKGFRVDVYGNPKPENRYKAFDGVTYRPSQSFNPLLERGHLIIWRHWGYLDLPLRAKSIILDLHDVQFPRDLAPARLAKIKAAVFKSDFHLDPVREICGDKARILRNGVDPSHLSLTPAARRLKHLVYASSADRGLKSALRIFARVKALHPDATLDCFYGFTPLYFKKAAESEYQFFGDDQAERHMLDYAEECFELCDRVGAGFRGRIGHAALAEELQTSSVLLYPTRFPEISCMAALEAQAAGCIPVTSDMGALKESNKHGVLVPKEASDDAYVSAIHGIFSKGADLDTHRLEMSESILSSYNFDALAAEWLELLNA
jgi:glycosyltransferase involved in cell wall biosynthesis